MGLKVDIDKIFEDNMTKQGYRKYGTVLVNMGDKLTKEQKLQLQKENQKKYGLSKDYLEALKLPKPTNIKIYDVEKIIHGRKKFTISEKLDHLFELQKTL
jgi:hypothetical protein